MITIGITGGIGSGKSSVSNFFSQNGIPVYDSDTRAKYLMNNHSIIKEKIKNEFGKLSYTSSGLDRKYISKIVFDSPSQLKKLEQIVHPVVATDFENWKNNQSTKLIAKEAAILIETKGYLDCDEVVVVVTDLGKKIERIIKRDNFSEEQINKRIQAQISDEKREEFATFIIKNNGTLQELEQNTLNLIKEINKKYL